jgi:putative oxidoreductase
MKLDRLQPLALLILRIVLGAIMIGHGYHKVFGGGLVEHYHRVQALGLPGFLAIPSAIAEFFGGILVVAGLFTRISAAAILIDMAVAIWKFAMAQDRLGWKSCAAVESLLPERAN